MVLTRKQKEALDKQFENRGKIILFNGGRQYGKSFVLNYLLTKQWPEELLAHISKKETTYSEPADAEEIK